MIKSAICRAYVRCRPECPHLPRTASDCSFRFSPARPSGTDRLPAWGVHRDRADRTGLRPRPWRGRLVPLIVAPMGASAVLVFAVPASPLAQPWPVVGGNAISALVGVVVARVVADPVIAVGLAVSLAIAAMSLTRSLHPPGGAAALTAASAGRPWCPPVFCFRWCRSPPTPLCSSRLASSSTACPAVPIRIVRPRRRPIRTPPTTLRPSFAPAFRGRRAMRRSMRLHETFDIDRADVVRLLDEIERQALLRSHGGATAAQTSCLGTW